MTALWVAEAAARFWSADGGPPDRFPRDLRRAVALALPVAVVDLPRLRIASVDAWLEKRGVAIPDLVRDRPLRACLLARNGFGIIFLDGADPDDERRFSLAHETAHFIVEYVLPREEALSRIGPEALPVLDGRRPATRRERTDAMLSGVSLDLNLHLMERTPDGHIPTARISAAERCADTLALELLAPAQIVREHLPPGPDRGQTEHVLRDDFGLPELVARSYAGLLLPEPVPDTSLLNRLGLRPPVRTRP